MKNFFYGEYFFGDLDDLLFHLDATTKEDIENYPDDFKLEVELGVEEPFVQLSSKYIIDVVADKEEERLSESCDELSKLQEILDGNIDFDKINALIPRLYYADRTAVITKQCLLDWLS